MNASAGQTIKFSGRTWYEILIRERKGPSRGLIQKGEPHERYLCAPKFEERTPEETSRQEEYARKASWDVARKIYKLKAEDKATFHSSMEIKAPVPASKNTEERMFVVDSEASMHMLSKKDLSSGEMDTLRRSRNPTTVVTANVEVQTNEEAQVYVQDLYLFVTVQLLDETPAVLSLGKLCSEHGCSYEWKNSETPRLTQNGKTITQTTDNFVPLVVPCLSSSSSSSSASASRPKDRRAKHACGKPMQTDFDRQASESRGSAHTEDEMDEEDTTQGIPDWLQPFTENLKDLETHVPAHPSEREISDSEGDASKVEPQKRKHSIFTHFPKDRNCGMCLRTKIIRVPFRRRNKESMPRAEQFADVITADHKVINEGSESWNNHIGTRSRHSVDTILSLQKQEFAKDGEESTKVFGAVTETKSYEN